jgi:hypothetical protein
MKSTGVGTEALIGVIISARVRNNSFIDQRRER